MQIQKKDRYTFIQSDENTFEEFYNNFKKSHQELEKEQIILEISDTLNITIKEISLFLVFAEAHKQNGTSFVFIQKNVDVDDFPETFNIVPTLIEAEDIIEMEAIERELGF